jgi:hypothetical protein
MKGSVLDVDVHFLVIFGLLSLDLDLLNWVLLVGNDLPFLQNTLLAGHNLAFLDCFNLFYSRVFEVRIRVSLSLSHSYLSFLGGDRPDLLSYLLDFIVKGSLFLEVSQLISVSFVFEVLSLSTGHRLPLLPHFLHDLQRSHFWMLVNNEWPSLKNGLSHGGSTSLTKII